MLYDDDDDDDDNDDDDDDDDDDVDERTEHRKTWHCAFLYILSTKLKFKPGTKKAW